MNEELGEGILANPHLLCLHCPTGNGYQVSAGSKMGLGVATWHRCLLIAGWHCKGAGLNLASWSSGLVAMLFGGGA